MISFEGRDWIDITFIMYMLNGVGQLSVHEVMIRWFIIKIISEEWKGYMIGSY